MAKRVAKDKKPLSDAQVAEIQALEGVFSERDLLPDTTRKALADCRQNFAPGQALRNSMVVVYNAKLYSELVKLADVAVKFCTEDKAHQAKCLEMKARGLALKPASDLDQAIQCLQQMDNLSQNPRCLKLLADWQTKAELRRLYQQAFEAATAQDSKEAKGATADLLCWRHLDLQRLQHAAGAWIKALSENQSAVLCISSIASVFGASGALHHQVCTSACIENET